MKKIYSFITLTTLCFSAAQSYAATMEEDLLSVQQQWAVVKYQTPAKQQKEAAENLTKKAEEVAAAHPNKAEPLIWEAISFSTEAGMSGGLGALGKAKKARELLFEAEKINPNALNGSAYVSLGTLYYKVPGWPVGFGDKKKAKEYLLKALAINPDGIDPNFFYAELMFEEKQYDECEKYLQKSLNASARPNRELADKGRKKEASELLEKLKAKRHK